MVFFESTELKRGLSGEEVSPPSGVCFSGGSIVVSDEFNHRLELVRAESDAPVFVGKRGAGEGEFYYPKGVQADGDGNFYVADCWNHRVQKFSEKFEFILSFGKYGDAPGEFNEPYSIAVGPDDLIYVVDRCNHRIQFFDTAGNFMGLVGQRGTALEEGLAELYGTPENLFKKPAFEFPNDIAFDSLGNMFVVDSNNHRIVCLDRQGEFLYAFGSKGSGEEEFLFPFGICIDKNDLLFISDMNNERVSAFTPEGVLAGSYKGGAANMVCPASIKINPAGEVCYTTGFSTSLFFLGYSHFKLSEFYKNDSSRRKTGPRKTGPRKTGLRTAAYLYGRGEKEAAVETFLSFITGCAPGDLIEEIRCRPEYVDLFLKAAGHSGNSFDTINALFESSFEDQKKLVKELREKRVELARELFENQHRRESEILSGQDTFNPALITIEREDRALFREIRMEVLKLKRVFAFNASLPGRILAYEREDTLARNSAVEATALHTLTLLGYVLEVLEEREGCHAERERCFRDETKDREDNLAEFRFFTLLFDNVDSLTGVFVDLLKSRLAEIIRIGKSLSQEEGERLGQVLCGSSGAPELAELLSKIYLFTQDNGVPAYASIQPVLKEFASMFFRSALKSVDPENPFCVAGNENVLKQVFHLMIFEELFFEELFFDSCEKFTFNLAPDKLEVHEKSFEEVNDAIENAFAESERISVEAALIDVQVNKTVVRDEKLRITLANRLNLHSFAERLNARTLGSLFLMQRVNLIALFKCKGSRKRAERVSAMLNRSFDGFYKIPAGMSESEAGKVKALLSLKVNALKNLIKKNFLDIATIYDLETGKPDIRGFSGITLKNSISDTGRKQCAFINPAGICVEPGGSLLVADCGSNTVVRMTEDGRFIERWPGREGFGGNFFHPFGIAVDSNGNVFVSDWYRHRVQKFDSAWNFISSFGCKGEGAGKFNMPGRIAIDRENVVYVCDQMNGRIQKFDNLGNHILSFGGKGEDNGGAFKRPGGILVTSSGELLVGDYSGSIVRLFSLDGAYISDFYSMTGSAPPCVVDISQGADGTIFISDFWNGELTLLTSGGEYLGKTGGEGRGKTEFLGLAASQVAGNSIFCCDFFGGKIKIIGF